jgi:hypothetical protein
MSRSLLFFAFFFGLLGLVSSQCFQLAPVLQNVSLLASSTITCSGSSIITGDMDLSPGSSITGFPSPCTELGNTNIGSSVAVLAQSALSTAITQLQGLTGLTVISGTLGGTVTPGVYNTTCNVVTTLTLNGPGLYIFWCPSTLTTSTSASIILTNGARACDVFWYVGSSATLGTSTIFVGSILAVSSITNNGGVGAIVNGRMLAQTAAITISAITLVNTTTATCSSFSYCSSSSSTAASGASSSSTAVSAPTGTSSSSTGASTPSVGSLIGKFAVFDANGGNSTGLTVITTGNLGQWNSSTAFAGFPPGTLTSGVNLVAGATTLAASADLLALRLQLLALETSSSAVKIAAELGGVVLTPGVYLSATNAFQISPNLNLTLSGNGTFIFLGVGPTGTLTVGSGSNVLLTNKASGCQVLWKCRSASIGNAANFVGNVVSTLGIVATNGGGATFAGSLWAGADQNTATAFVNLNATTNALCTGTAAVIPTPTTSSFGFKSATVSFVAIAVAFAFALLC